MSAQSRSAQQLARQLFKLSLEDGAISPERVAGLVLVAPAVVAPPRKLRRLMDSSPADGAVM